MDLKQLRYFKEVIAAGSMSGAARQCGISQPAISQCIKDLETQLDEQLVTRGRRGVVTTDAGRLLLQHAERLLAEEDSLLQQFAARGELRTGSINFGIIPTLAPYLLPLLLSEFRSQYPAITIDVSERKTPDLVRLIAEGAMEFAILSDVTSDDQKRFALKTKLMFSEPLLLALPRQHQLALREDSPLPTDLNSDELIHLSDGHCLGDQTLEICRLSRGAPRLQCDQLETALAMVAANLGYAVVPKLAVRDRERNGITFRSFASPGPARKVFLLKKSGTKLSKPAEKLIKILGTDLLS
ncbi:MAG: LysR family transcriptional regulator [Verrucomicrobiales bacterium]|jgi:LysR family transcriptional regulator, hydrogen peroxide-inducible genes activator|nr:LysR family transcriptional regulator [Verrucomicrobiales bacterium]